MRNRDTVKLRAVEDGLPTYRASALKVCSPSATGIAVLVQIPPIAVNRPLDVAPSNNSISNPAEAVPLNVTLVSLVVPLGGISVLLGWPFTQAIVGAVAGMALTV